MASKGGFDVEAMLSGLGGACGVDGYDAGNELVHVREAFAPDVIRSADQLERPILDDSPEGPLSRGAYPRLVLHGAQRVEERTFGEGFYDDYGARRFDDAGRFLKGALHVGLRDVVERVEEYRAVEGIVGER